MAESLMRGLSRRKLLGLLAAGAAGAAFPTRSNWAAWHCAESYRNPEESLRDDHLMHTLVIS